MNPITEALAERGFAVLATPGFSERVASEPWSAAEELLGETPLLVERQPIRPIAQAVSFASGRIETPLHTDSQPYRGLPPDLQIMSCLRPAERGGETHLLDTWELLAALEAEEPALFEALFTAVRRIPFYFGDVIAQTVQLRCGRLAFTHAPITPPHDPIAHQLERALAARPRVVVRVAAGETLLVDNRRMLHGRAAFEDMSRAFERMLVWTAQALPAPARFVERAADEAARLARRIAGSSEAVAHRVGQATGTDPDRSRRLAIVLALLRGVPPGLVARRTGEPEAKLYRYRDAALLAAEKALGDADLHAVDGELARLFPSLFR